MRLVVTGGRDYCETQYIWQTLDWFHENWPITTLIHGAAKGVDRRCAMWAQKNNIPEQPFPADWESEGKAAGPLRNQRMIDRGFPDHLLAFPGGRGTQDMIRRCEAAGIFVTRAGR